MIGLGGYGTEEDLQYREDQEAVWLETGYLMPSKHKTPLLGWHPKSAGLAAWARAEAERRGVPLARILDEALEAYRDAHSP